MQPVTLLTILTILTIIAIFYNRIASNIVCFLVDNIVCNICCFIVVNTVAILSIQDINIVLYCHCIVNMATIISCKIASIGHIGHIVHIALGSNKLLQLLRITAMSDNIFDNCVQCDKICKSIA